MAHVVVPLSVVCFYYYRPVAVLLFIIMTLRQTLSTCTCHVHMPVG